MTITNIGRICTILDDEGSDVFNDAELFGVDTSTLKQTRTFLLRDTITQQKSKRHVAGHTYPSERKKKVNQNELPSFHRISELYLLLQYLLIVEQLRQFSAANKFV